MLKMVKSLPVMVPYYSKVINFVFKGFFKYFDENVRRFRVNKPTIETK